MRKKILSLLLLILVSILIWLSDSSQTEVVFNSLNSSNENGHLVEFDNQESNSKLLKAASFNKGTYHATITYTASNDLSYLVVKDNGIELYQSELPSSANELSFDISPNTNSAGIEFSILYSGMGYLSVDELTITPKQPFYNDTFATIILIWLVVFICFLIHDLYQKKKLTLEQYQYLWIIVALSVFSSLPFLSNTFSFSGDDLAYHLSRIEGIKNGLLSGQFPVVIYPEALNRNGYLNTMYPSLFLYIPALLRICGVSYVASYKFLLIIIQILTVICTSVAIRKMGGNHFTIILGSILFLFLRYRLTNIFVRASLGETLGLIFLPLIILGIYQILWGDSSKWYYLFLGMSGVLQSHILSFMIFVLLLLVITLTGWRQLFHKQRVIALIKSAILTIICNLYFLVPFLYYYRSNMINSSFLEINYASHALEPAYLFSTGLSDYTDRPHSLGLSIIICLFLIIAYLIFKDKHTQLDKFLVTLTTMACVCLFMSTTLFPNSNLMNVFIFNKVFSYLQFPWRLVGPAAFLIIFVFCIAIESIKLEGTLKYILIFSLILLTLGDMSIWQKGTVINTVGYKSNELQTNQSLSHLNRITLKDLDLTSRYPNEWRYSTAKDNTLMTTELSLPSGSNVAINYYERDNKHIEFSYLSNSKNSYVDIPLFQYNCYKAVDENSVSIPLETNESGKIRIFLSPDGVEHSISISYQFPVIFHVATFLSFGVPMLLFILSIFKRKKIH